MLKKKKTTIKAFKKMGIRYDESIKLKILNEIQSYLSNKPHLPEILNSG